MEVYLINLFLAYIFLLFSRAKGKKIQKIFFVVLSFLCITIVAGIRYGVGTDFFMYEDFFGRMDKYKLFRKDLEVIFIALCKIIRIFTTDSTILFICIACLIYYFIYNISIKNVEKYELSIFLFIAFGFFTNSLNLLRQWMAIPFIFKAFDLFSENNKKFGIFSLILACLSHYTCVFIIPVLFLIYKIRNEKLRISIIIMSIIMYLGRNVITKIIYIILTTLNIGGKYIKYLIDYEEINTNIFVMPMFTLIIYVGYLIFLRKKEYESDKEKKFNNYMVNFTIFGFFTSLLGTRLMIFERIQFYFLLAIVFLIPNIISNTKKSTKIFLYSFCMVMGVAFYIYSLNKNGGEPLPYRTIFNKLL